MLEMAQPTSTTVCSKASTSFYQLDYPYPERPTSNSSLLQKDITREPSDFADLDETVAEKTTPALMERVDHKSEKTMDEVDKKN